MNTEISDDDLIARVALGEAAAFDVLVGRHQSRLLALAARMTDSRTLAEDVVQECFTRAWVQAPRWRPLGRGRTHGVAAWLSRTALNLSIDQMRRPRATPLDAAPEPADPAPPADEAMIAGARAARLGAAVQALPLRQRAAISLTYDTGLSNAEGAAALEISVGAFELLLVRARRALRAAVAEAGP